ncbi:hypothetical protein CL1_1847 [Thermococcus cleftensis]|uniref:DUF998 domain-containing protein n=1 Tax=Thermococcus cleftensis (strain DSM 27260 / KACC 17922 / CL1) TaxID=163003 RepID=I3ZWF9_THECF|nr:DUF998 domain-containing protein [Thermococcus cleftensis]AFL96043.1 hypothetical protein CL1_1847 [Thermococcus cleftensis]
MREKLVWFGFMGALVYWSFVAWSISRNPWFSFWKNALSDLGGPGANSPWIYNAGLVVSSLFLLAFSVGLILTSEGRLQTVGGAYLSISSVFLALIGIFHEGTEPHVFVSTYFFVQFFLGALLYGLGSERLRPVSVLIFSLALVGPLVPFPSTSLLETYEILLVMAFSLAVALNSKGFTGRGASGGGG